MKTTKTSTFSVEYTDTFGGEANYSWVYREEISLPENSSYLAVIRAAKKVMGLNGVRGRTTNFGDMIEFRPYGACTVLFIIYKEEEVL